MDNTPGAREQGPPPLLIEAVSYAEDRHWEVVPGTWLVDGDGPAHCSCGDLGCALPGAHPAEEDWRRRASAGPGVVRRWWTERPEASVLLPTGSSFDVLDVPEVAGCLALARMERMGLQLGPVVAVPAASGRAGRRLHFLVLPGVAAKVPEMLRKLGWAPGRLDLVARGEGDHVVAPPSRIGPYGFAQWARPPSAINRWLPDAAELINPLAYACGREVLQPLRPQPGPVPAAVR
ncbi:bifunctional DNA primase/polymerase [Kitasatospora sp. DSM 101779]|uniref:bifunctional DNA primase/polymerase n=1 Tax=Kitasatospora sp. DSM 101779 TaxID=2853165 RepID=UPI0021D93C70|nr:bifunctional DNA primase/polymerase [Kitasatospora sp. DSM 101779]MCU7823301.1 bifunctional DNA primase/polymerase [Kitasatospora sp. DSM 101779]